MATSILLFFFTTSWFKEKKTERLLQEAKGRMRDGHFHSYCSSLRGWGDGNSHSSYSSLRDGGMATSILFIPI